MNDNYLEEIKRIKGTLGNKELQRSLAKLIKQGVNEYNLSRIKSENKPIQSYISSKGIERAEKIGNEICNSNNILEKFGVTVDVFSASNIPIMYLDDLAITIKSLKNPESIIKNKTGYIKEYSKCNRSLDSQIDMFDFLDSPLNKENHKFKYYCILLYHISHASNIEYMEFVFLNEEANKILFKIKVDDDVFKLEEKITYKNQSIVTEEQIKGKSLKDLVRIK
ncbi:hypothetical protein [Clostridium perfringens]|uniref:hypothetical protein n=1 Tax=Clostridium perfringens TaxID=1502 RepID=UPI0018D9F431|nr:hypothetical protein [Clostridium perfringens]ELC8464946.1 hypothetical protein [Clostridium perfringens]MBO3311651.1 hypothetical protein [Clostridium perfringens]MCR1963668.1 hypothetical protein [Clostridium perfringens]QPR51099.1 hypothetical protein I6G88_13550 [Clostridium perfringens]